MDWNAAIEKNREALKRVLAMLVAMAGLEGCAVLTSPLWGGRRSPDRRVGVNFGAEPPPDASRRPPRKAEVGLAFTLPRHLRLAVLRLLRPAEAAARRLIIVAARGMVVKARPWSPTPVGTVVPPPPRIRSAPPPASRVADGRQARLSFPLFDPLRRFRRRRPAARGVPRISFPGFGEPFRIPPPPSPDDAVDAGRLAMRLAALARVLDDLPREARRFARWRARRELTSRAKSSSPSWEGARGGGSRRVWPLRPGRPPGQPPARGGRPRHEVHDILDVTHGLAFWVLEKPDTS